MSHVYAVAQPIPRGHWWQARPCSLVRVVALAMLQSCAALDPQAEVCPDLSGRYVSHAEQDSDSLLVYLVDNRAVAPSSVVLQSTAEGLRVTAGEVKASLAHPKDFMCKGGTEIVLSRHPTTHLRLPPLIDQTVVRSYTFRRAPSGDLALDVYAQSIGRPYGLKLSSPVKLEKTIVWKRVST